MGPCAGRIEAREREPTLIRAADNVLFHELGGEAVLVKLDTGVYFGLNSVAARLWQLLREHGGGTSPRPEKGGPPSQDQIERVMEACLAELDVEETTLRRDLAELIDQLTAKGLVVVTPPAPPD